MLRPLAAEEIPHLVAMGEALRETRRRAGLTQQQVATLATVTGGHLSVIERGKARTRRSTLERLVAAMVPEVEVAGLVEDLVGLVGPGLAPESDYVERLKRRRARRARRERPAKSKALSDGAAETRRMAKFASPAVAERFLALADRFDQIAADLSARSDGVTDG
jgi:transcriptional regulator with XRE-family HTH domain